MTYSEVRFLREKLSSHSEGSDEFVVHHEFDLEVCEGIVASGGERFELMRQEQASTPSNGNVEDKLRADEIHGHPKRNIVLGMRESSDELPGDLEQIKWRMVVGMPERELMPLVRFDRNGGDEVFLLVPFTNEHIFRMRFVKKL